MHEHISTFTVDLLTLMQDRLCLAAVALRWRHELQATLGRTQNS
jgi:hypothetical protein